MTIATHPHFMQALVAGLAPYQTITRKVWNRTGGTLTQYGCYQFDQSFASNAAESSANSRGFTLPAVTHDKWAAHDSSDGVGSCWNNIVPVATIGGSSPLAHSIYAGNFCIAQTAAADNEEVEVVLYGITPLYIIAANSAEVRAGATLIPSTAATYLSVPTFSTATHKYIGRLRAAYTEATPAAATLQNTAGFEPFFCGFGLLR